MQDELAAHKPGAGYLYDTPGDFRATAIRDFPTFLPVGGMPAGTLAAMNIIAIAPVIAMILILPDPSDVEASLFLCDIHDFFANNRPVLLSVQGLQESALRSVVEATEARAALVHQRAGLFGSRAVLGLVLAIISPFMGFGLV